MSERFSENLRIARACAGITQSELAALVNISKSTISLYETGKREPDILKLKALAKALNVSCDALVGLAPLPDNEICKFISEYGIKRIKAYIDALKHLE